MNFRQTEIFKVIMETGSITQAASRLCVSQPSISKSLQTLEHDLQLRLFERTARGLVATMEAHALYEEVERAYSGITSLARYAAGMRHMKHGRLVICAVAVLAVDWLPRVVARFMKDYPEANLTIRSWDSSRTGQMVAEGQVDLGIAQSKLNELSVLRRKLFDVETVCALPVGHPLCTESSITPEHLKHQTIVLLSSADEIRAQFESVMEKSHVPFTSFVDVSLGATLCALVEQGCGVGLVDAETAARFGSSQLVFRPFAPRIVMSIYLLRSTTRTPSMIASRFEDYLMEDALRTSEHATPVPA